MNIYCPIVIYNSYVENSPAVKKLKEKKCENCVIIVVDNSSKDIVEKNRFYCKQNEIIHLDMGGNIGLSKATNKALEYIAQLCPDDNDLVVTLNDDTAVTIDYIEMLKVEADSNPDVDIFAPYMQGQNGVLYSPAKAGFFKNHYMNNTDEDIPQNKFFAIYSCCSCKWIVYKNYRYDEKLFMDLIDNNFCDDQRRIGRKFKSINLILQQNYALKNDGLTMEKIQRRWKIWIPDFLVYCKKNNLRMLGYYPAIAARGVMLSLKCKDIRFWFWGISYATKCLRTR